MEELSATQEEMQRIMKEVEAKQAYITSLLNVSTDSIYTIDRDFQSGDLEYCLRKIIRRIRYAPGERVEHPGLVSGRREGKAAGIV